MGGTFGSMGFASVNPTKFFPAGGQGGIVWANNDTLGERMGWAIENGLAHFGGQSKLPSFRRSFGTEDGQPEHAVPFAGHCMRSPSEWHAAFLRQELISLPSQIERFR